MAIERQSSSIWLRRSWTVAAITALLAVATPRAACAQQDGVASIADPDAWKEPLRERVRFNQGFWTVNLVITGSMGVIPITARQIHWSTNRACDHELTTCGMGTSVYADAVFAPFSAISLAAGVPGSVASKITLATVSRDIDEASSREELAVLWQRKSRAHGAATAITAGVGVPIGLVLIATSDMGTSYQDEVGFGIATGSGAVALTLLHVALTYALMEQHARKDSDNSTTMIHRTRGPRLTAISPLGISGVW